MYIEIKYPGTSDVMAMVESAFEELHNRPMYGLLHIVDNFERAKPGCSIMHQRVDFWVTINGRKLPIRIEELPSRPVRKYLRDLIGPNKILTILVYPKMKWQTLLRKVAKCIKVGLDRIRRRQNNEIFLKRNPVVRTFRNFARLPERDFENQLRKLGCYYSS